MKIGTNNWTQSYKGIQKKGGEENTSTSDKVSIGEHSDTSWMMKDIGNLKSFDPSEFDCLDNILFGAIGAGVGATGGAIAGAFLGGGWGSLGGGVIGAVVGGFVGGKLIAD